MSKRINKAFVVGTLSACAYSFVKGNGIFNKPRFYPQYKAISKYLSSSSPNANIGKIFKTKEGFGAVINDNGDCYLLSITKIKGNDYMFSKTEM